MEGIGFAIPISTATDIIDELIANGEVTSRPTLGVSLYNVEDEMTASHLGVDSTGVYIVQIVDGGAADNAGLRSGDRIVRVDGSEVSSASDVRAALNKHKIGESISITVERNGQTQDFDVAL